MSNKLASKFRAWKSANQLIPGFSETNKCEYCEGYFDNESIAQDLSVKHGHTYCHACAEDLSDTCSVCDDRTLKAKLRDRLFSLVCGDCDRA